MLTAINLMLFSLLHNPCATTIFTMWKETRSAKWTTLGALMPLVIAFAVTFAVARVSKKSSRFMSCSPDRDFFSRDRREASSVG